ncbi:GNAT family N-acetyltransferase [Pelosinus sp. Bkl1]|uniref:GNAT family N-acetyltransferase n=2 Tax=Pelosinus baikalensis TaxID=2892015 RepID=A0ABS8HR77_9FIRM|nr:GNAT family N-acetyltransferase [Pelosinus baikalensis]
MNTKKYHIEMGEPFMCEVSNEIISAKGKDIPILLAKKDDDHIEIRYMKLCEAVDVVRLIYQCYGYTYFYENFYYPEHIAEYNERGVMRSLVAVNKNGEIIGHMTLFRNEIIGNIARTGTKEECKLGEPSMVMVRPDYRNMNIFSRMMNRVMKEDLSYTKNLSGLFSPPISEHIYSQLAMYKCGFKDCGCLLGNYPPAEIKDISNKQSQRISLVLTYYSLQNRKNKIIYPPSQHRKMILDIYGNLGAVPNWEEPQCHYDDQSYKETSLIKAKIVPKLNNASIKVSRYGADIVECVKKKMKEMLAKNTEAILLYLSLNDPLTYKFAEQFEQMGFFFAGVLPAMSIGDALILQYLNASNFDYNKVQIASKNAKEILDYVRKCELKARHMIRLVG